MRIPLRDVDEQLRAIQRWYRERAGRDPSPALMERWAGTYERVAERLRLAAQAQRAMMVAEEAGDDDEG